MSSMKLEFDLPPKHRNRASVDLYLLSEAQLKTHRRVIIQIPCSTFTSSMEGLGDVRDDLLTPQQQVKLVLLMAYLCEHPYYCMNKDPAKRTTMDEALYKMGKSSKGQNILEARVVVHFEVIRGTNHEIVAYRYFFDCQDDEMDFDVGIETLINKEKEMMDPKKKVKRPSMLHTTNEGDDFWDIRLKTRNEWIDAYLGAYNHTATQPRFKITPVTDETYGAHIYTFCSATYCDELSGKPTQPWLIRPQQANMKDNYVDSVTGKLVFPFPEDTFCIPLQQVTPVLFFHCRFPHLSPIQRPRPLNYHQLNERIEMALERYAKAKTSSTLRNKDRFDGFELLLVANHEYLEAIPTASERWLWRNSPAALTSFGATWATGGGIKTIKALARWGNRHPKLISHVEIPMDPTLSPFANFVANKFKFYEEIYGVKNMHLMLFTVWIGALGAFNHSHDLKTNFLFTGASQTGKSFVMEVIEKFLSITGTITKVTHQTECAFKTTSDFMYTVLMYDEFTNKMLGLDKEGKMDGTGDSSIKSLLTEQYVYVLAYHQDENGKRETMVDKNPMISVVIGASNNAKNCIHEAMGSRYYMHDCVDLDRPGHSVQEKKQALAMAETSTRQNIKLVKERHNYEHKKIQYLVAMIEQLIHVRLLEDVDMTVALQVFQHEREFIAAQGFDTAQDRHNLRWKNMARTLTIVYAIQLVFNTTLIHKDETESFSFAQVMQVQPFLVCTEEIALFCCTALLDMFVDTNEAIPIEALASSKCHYTSLHADADAAAIYKKLPNNTLDYNYLMVENIRGSFAAQESQTQALAKAAHMAMSGARMSIESITDMLSNLAHRKMQVKHLWEQNENNSVVIPIAKTMPILVIDKPTSAVFILRHFIDKTRTEDYSNIGMKAVMSYSHRYIRPRDIITALPYIHEMPISPHILRTAVLTQDERFMKLSLPGIGLDARSTVQAINCDFEDITYHHYVRLKCGILDETLRLAYSPRALDAWQWSICPINRAAYPKVMRDEYKAAEQLRIAMMAKDDMDQDTDVDKIMRQFAFRNIVDADIIVPDSDTAMSLQEEELHYFRSVLRNQLGTNVHHAYGEVPTLTNIQARIDLEKHLDHNLTHDELKQHLAELANGNPMDPHIEKFLFKDSAAATTTTTTTTTAINPNATAQLASVSYIYDEWELEEGPTVITTAPPVASASAPHSKEFQQLGKGGVVVSKPRQVKKKQKLDEQHEEDQFWKHTVAPNERQVVIEENDDE